MQNYEQYLSILRTIKTSNPSKGVAQEYGYLAYKYGERNVDWRLKRQMLINHEELDGSITPVDVFQIVLDDGKEVEIYIDISSFYAS